MLCPELQYQGEGLKKLRCSMELVIVHAKSEDVEMYAAFHNELVAAQDECRSSSLMKWKECAARQEFRAAEARVVQSPSFKEDFFDKVVMTFDADFALFRGTLWAKDTGISREDCQAYLEEFFRREALHTGRVSPEEFFSHNRADDDLREHIPESVRHEVWRRDEGKCTACGSRVRLEFDHIIPVALGGSSTARNLQLLCESCNRAKGATLGRSESSMA